MYCGSDATGTGCVYNPYNNLHIRGADFLNKTTVQAEKAMILNYFLNKFKKQQISEKYSSPLDRLYKRVSSIFYSFAEPFLEALMIQETSVYSKLSKSDMVKAYDYKVKFAAQFKEFNKIVKEAYKNLPPEIVEESMAEAILMYNEH
jgi:hypothetical protein